MSSIHVHNYELSFVEHIHTCSTENFRLIPLMWSHMCCARCTPGGFELLPWVMVWRGPKRWEWCYNLNITLLSNISIAHDHQPPSLGLPKTLPPTIPKCHLGDFRWRLSLKGHMVHVLHVIYEFASLLYTLCHLKEKIKVYSYSIMMMIGI